MIDQTYHIENSAKQIKQCLIVEGDDETAFLLTVSETLIGPKRELRSGEKPVLRDQPEN